MTDETPLTQEEQYEIAMEEAVLAYERIHEIERIMLTRAIDVIAKGMGVTPELVVQNLANGIDMEYGTAVNTATAATKLIKPGMDKKLTIPKIVQA
jgi:hypothetical protein